MQVRLPHFSLHVDLRCEFIGFPLFVAKTYEPAETAFVERTVERGTLFCDIGANIGYFTVLASKLVGDAGKVVAVEPDPHNFELLQQNIELNRCVNVEAINIALGQRAASGVLFKSPINSGDHCLFKRPGEDREAVNVPVNTFDEIVGGARGYHSYFIKMDVQGFEWHVQGGMRELLASDKPITFLTEFWPFGIAAAGGDPEQFINTFTSNGFSAHVLLTDGISPPQTMRNLYDFLPPFDKSFPDKSYVNVVFKR